LSTGYTVFACGEDRSTRGYNPPPLPGRKGAQAFSAIRMISGFGFLVSGFWFLVFQFPPFPPVHFPINRLNCTSGKSGTSWMTDERDFETFSVKVLRFGPMKRL
jgi:hypothetical protein